MQGAMLGLTYVALFSFLIITMYWMVDHRATAGVSWLDAVKEYFGWFMTVQALILALFAGTLQAL